MELVDQFYDTMRICTACCGRRIISKETCPANVANHPDHSIDQKKNLEVLKLHRFPSYPEFNTETSDVNFFDRPSCNIKQCGDPNNPSHLSQSSHRDTSFGCSILYSVCIPQSWLPRTPTANRSMCIVHAGGEGEKIAPVRVGRRTEVVGCSVLRRAGLGGRRAEVYLNVYRAGRTLT